MILRIRQPNRPERTLKLEQDRGLRFGSDPMNDVVLDAPEVQPLHFGVSFTNNAFYATASSMAKSITINGTPVPKAKLKPNDRLEIGPVKISVESETPAAAPVAEEDEFGLLMEEELAPAPAAAKSAPAQKPAQPTEEEDEFGLAPLDDEPKPAPKEKEPANSSQASQPAKQTKSGEDDDLFGLADDPEVAALSTPNKTPTQSTSKDEFGLDAPRGKPSGPGDQADFGLDPLGDDDPLGGSGMSDSRFGSDFLEDAQADIAASGVGQGSYQDPLSDPLMDPLADPLLATGPGQQQYPGMQQQMPLQPQEPGLIGKIFASAITQAAIGLIFLGVAAAVIIGILQNQPKPEDFFQLANDHFANERYPQAMEHFDVFLTYYPAHPRAEEARVKRGLAEWLPVVETQGDLNQALATAQETLEDWDGLSRHPIALKRMPDLLIPVAEGLVQRLMNSSASGDELEAQLQAASQAVELVRRHVPPDIQLERNVDQLNRQIREFQNERQETNLLEKSISEIKAAINQGSIDQAYAVREDLLNEFPQLAARSTLYSAMGLVSQAEASRVQGDRPNKAALSDPPEQNPFSYQHTAFTSTSEASGNGQPVLVESHATGALFVVDGSSGQMLWRAFLGNSFAAMLDEDGVLAVDMHREELVRFEAKNGQLLWRQPVPQVIGKPTLAGGLVWVAADEGKVYAIDQASGQLVQQYRFPQALLSPPGVDPENQRAYQVGEHSHLYVVDTQAQQCVEAVYLGHSPGSVLLPPVVMQGFVFVFEELGLNRTRLHVFTSRSKQLRKLQTLEINDQIAQRPLQLGEYLFVLTNSGLLQSYKLVPDDAQRPLQAGPSTQLARSGGPSYVKIFGEELWAAGDEVLGFELPPRPDRIVLNYRFALEGTPTQAPQRIGETVIGMQSAPSFGVQVSSGSTSGQIPGTNIEDLPLQLDAWQTNLAAPAALLASEKLPAVQVHAFGGVQIDGKPAGRIERLLHQPMTAQGSWEIWGDETAIYLPAAGADALLLYQASNPSVQSVPLPGSLAAQPVRWQNEVLIPLNNGALFLFNPLKQQALGTPLLVPLSPEAGWQTPAILSNEVAVISDGQQLIRVHRTTDGLQAAGSQPLENRCVSPLAAAGNWVWFADAAGTLNAFDGETIHAALESPTLFGPHSLGGKVLVGSTRGKLYSLGDKSEPSWQLQLTQAPPAGVVSVDSQTIALALTDGTLLFLRAGELVGKPLELAQPVVQAPVFDGTRLLLPTADGSYYSTTQLP